MAYQEEVVQTLERAMESANVMTQALGALVCHCTVLQVSVDTCSNTGPLAVKDVTVSAATPPAVLWSSWHWQDIHSPGSG